jgi:hypothetical protein
MSYGIGKIILFGDSLTELSWDQCDGFNLAPALQHGKYIHGDK